MAGPSLENRAMRTRQSTAVRSQIALCWSLMHPWWNNENGMPEMISHVNFLSSACHTQCWNQKRSSMEGAISLLFVVGVHSSNCTTAFFLQGGSLEWFVVTQSFEIGTKLSWITLTTKKQSKWMHGIVWWTVNEAMLNRWSGWLTLVTHQQVQLAAAWLSPTCKHNSKQQLTANQMHNLELFSFFQMLLNIQLESQKHFWTWCLMLSFLCEQSFGDSSGLSCCKSIHRVIVATPIVVVHRSSCNNKVFQKRKALARQLAGLLDWQTAHCAVLQHCASGAVGRPTAATSCFLGETHSQVAWLACPHSTVHVTALSMHQCNKMFLSTN